jgi:adenylate cyclase
VSGTGSIRAASLADLSLCFEGAIPAIVATVAADGTPNVTFLSRVRMVDGEHIALSNQFFSKTVRNLAENPHASVLLVDPVSYRQYRLALAYERTERAGRVFELLHQDVEAVAAMQGMQGVFKLRGADVYRVLHIEVAPGARSEHPEAADQETVRARADVGPLAELSSRLGRCPDLDRLVGVALDGLAELFGFMHSVLMLLDEEGAQLYTIASRGYPTEGIGSEIPLGEDLVGMAAARCTPIRVGNVRHLSRYSRNVRRSYEDSGEIGPGRQIPIPGLAGAQSKLAVPAMARGQLVGVLVVESEKSVAYTPDDESLLTVVATLVADAVHAARSQSQGAPGAPGAPGGPGGPADAGNRARASSTEQYAHVRYFEVDGSVFIDGDYLIKGVAGRLLWSLLRQNNDEGRVEFTNREIRLDPSLELPHYRDNFENRLVLLKRRLDERRAPIRIDKAGRGRFQLTVGAELALEMIGL